MEEKLRELQASVQALSKSVEQYIRQADRFIADVNRMADMVEQYNKQLG